MMTNPDLPHHNSLLLSTTIKGSFYESFELQHLATTIESVALNKMPLDCLTSSPTTAWSRVEYHTEPDSRSL